MILDIIVIAVIALSVIFGYRKGFVKTILGAASFLIAMVLVFFLLDPAVSFISNSSLGETVFEHCSTLVGNSADNTVTAQEGALPQVILDALANSKATQVIEDAKTQMAKTLTEWVIKAMCFVGLFVAINILLFMLKPILDGIFKLPVLSLFNRLGGVIVGAVNGGVILLILMCLLLWLTTTEFAGSWCHSQLAQSQLASVIYYNNPVFSWFR